MLVHDTSTLGELAAAVAEAPIVAVDTEFVRESTYFPTLCLVQLATDKVTACVDCLADLDLEPLLEVLLAPERSWVLHSARQDLEVLWHRFGRQPSRLLDTQVAAALVGFAPQLGLRDLVAEMLGIQLDKSHTRTDWRRRPLANAALNYAIDDVRYLLPAWERLRAEARGPRPPRVVRGGRPAPGRDAAHRRCGDPARAHARRRGPEGRDACRGACARPLAREAGE